MIPTTARLTAQRLFHSRWLTVVLLWLGWWLILNVFQVVAFARLVPRLPDTAYAWSADRTREPEPSNNVLRLHTRWDSGFYVSIALYGYNGVSDAFFPLYPSLMRVTDTALLAPIWPAVDPVDRMELAGFIVSSIASLAAALGIFALIRMLLGEDDARRGVFYFLIYPPAIFLIQVYTESLFLALVTWCLVMTLRRRWWIAGSLAGVAVLERAAGITLLLPILVTWLLDWHQGRRPRWITLGIMPLPIVVWRLYFVWLRARGLSVVQGQAFFGRAFFPRNALQMFMGELSFVTNNPQATVHITLDVLFAVLAIATSLYALRRWPALGVFGLATMGLPLLTFRVPGLPRYSLAAIPIYPTLAYFGRSMVFDRLWTIASVLVMGLYLLLFVHGLWVS